MREIFEWDATKPDGQPGRMLDMSRAEKKFGWRAKVEFEEGVEEFGYGMLGWEDVQEIENWQ